VIDVVQQSLFDYASLDADTRVFVQEKAQAIHARLKRTAEDIIAIGQDLIAVKDCLPHGQFREWLQSEFDMSISAALKFAQVAQRFGDKSVNFTHLPASVLYALAAPSTPDTVIEMVETQQIPATIPTIREAKQEAQATNNGHGISELYSRSQGNPTLYTIPVDEGNSTVITPVEIDRVSHDDDPLEEVREKRDAHVMRVMGSSDSPEWYTPQEIVRLSIELLGEIDLDPCSNSYESPNIPARILYTKEDDGLAQSWEGKVYLNPPYGSEIPQWVEKLVKSYGHGVTEAIALLPARIDTIWFQPLYKFPMCNVRGRIQYENSPYHAPFPCVIVYLGEREADFIRVFKDRGPIMRRIG